MKGHWLGFNWICSKARKIQQDLTGDPDLPIPHYVVINLIQINN